MIKSFFNYVADLFTTPICDEQYPPLASDIERWEAQGRLREVFLTDSEGWSEVKVIWLSRHIGPTASMTDEEFKDYIRSGFKCPIGLKVVALVYGKELVLGIDLDRWRAASMALHVACISGKGDPYYTAGALLGRHNRRVHWSTGRISLGDREILPSMKKAALEAILELLNENQ